MEKILKFSFWSLCFFYLLLFLFMGFLLSPYDYDHLSGYYELAWRFWKTNLGLPHYNPFLCGGRTLGADPQIPIFNPLILFVPLIGSTWLIKLEMLSQLLIGTYALSIWLKRYSLETVQRYWGLFLYLAGGGIVSRFLVGHVTLGFYYLLPAFFVLSYQLSEEPKSNNTKKIFLLYGFLFIYSGLYKPNFFIYCVPTLFIEVLVRAGLSKNIRPLFYFLTACALSLLTNASTYLPAYDYFSKFPSRFDSLNSIFIPPYTLIANLLMPLKSIPKAWYGPVFLQRHEYNYFLGPVALIFALKTLRHFPYKKPELVSLLVFSLASFLLGMGYPQGSFEFLFPYRWFYEFWPGFKSIRVPPRFWFGGFLGLILFSTLGFSAPRSRLLKACLLFLGIFIPLLVATLNLSKTVYLASGTQWDSTSEYPTQILFTHNSPNQSYHHLKKGLGILDCVPNIAIDKNTLQSQGDSLSYVSDAPIYPSLLWNQWNEIYVNIHSKHQPFSMTLNLNYSPDWQFIGSGEVKIVPQRNAGLRLVSNSKVVQGTLIYKQPWVQEAFKLSMLSWSLFLTYALYVIKKGKKI